MARFTIELPTEIMQDFEKIHGNTEEIFGEMVKAGGEVVLNNIKANIPAGIRNSDMMNCLGMTRVYETPSDDGINVKVGFWGYFMTKYGEQHRGEMVPAPLVANVFEYGRSNAPFPKQPFMRKSFRKAQIEEAMLEAQRKASGGLLDE